MDIVKHYPCTTKFLYPNFKMELIAVGARRLNKLLLFFLLAGIQINCFAQSTPLLNAFAHNDYCHKHPLYDALENGFTSIEADIFLKDGKLIVAHIFPYFKGKRTPGRRFICNPCF